MLRNVVLLCTLASASAFVGSPVAPLLRNSPAVSSVRARPLRTSVKMVDADTIQIALAATPSIAALGLVFKNSFSGSEQQPQQYVPSQADTYSPQTSMPTETEALSLARTNFKKWNDALQTKDAATVAKMYSASKLSFLPTVSPEHIKQLDATNDYFKDFVKKNPFGTITDDKVTLLDANSYLHSGMYTFELGDTNNRTPVAARFSYVWEKVGNEWKIGHHHSSVRPPQPKGSSAPAQEAPAAKAAPSTSAKKANPTPEAMLPVARDNFKRWNDALQTKDPKTVAALYSDSELSFLPTVSPQHIKKIDSTQEYFEAFVLKNPFGTITDDSVIVFDDGESYLHSGMYTFELGDMDARTPVEARFSYVWKQIDGAWKIAHHHSSVRPQDAAPTPSQDEMHSKARENFKRWNDALQTKDPETVASLYTSKDLSFLPTVSPKHITNLDTTQEYFEAFVMKNPFGTITDDSVTIFDDGKSYLHSGMYTFELGEADARTPVEARFSYVWRNINGDWKISHHHSSVRPVEAAPTPTKEEMLPVARDNFKRWNDALQTKDPKTVAGLYSSTDLSFLPTVSPKHITKLDNTQEYFEAFVLKNPFGTITDDSVTVVDNGNGYLHSGMYTFELGEGEARAPVEARFSYMWKKFGNDWKITHHHSSVRPADAAPPPTPEEMLPVARDNFKRWNDALQTKNPKTVASLYSNSELSFLPTVSPEHIKKIDNTQEYFEAFVLKNPFGTITDDSVAVVDNGNGYLHSGMYTFELGTGADRAPVEARFSYMWKKFGNDWKITHHHSSVRPAQPSAAPAEASDAKVEEVMKMYKQAAERLSKETTLRLEQEAQLREVIVELEEIKKAIPQLASDK